MRYQDASAKLIKKDEHQMSTGFKNGKHCTNHIHLTKLVLLLAFLNSLPVSSSAARGDKNWVIVIDAGHGGKDPGALGSFSAEKNINSCNSLKTGSYIEKNLKNVTVIYTRKTDTFIEVKDRPRLQIRIMRICSFRFMPTGPNQRTIHGTETFVMGLAKDQQNLEVAMKENEVILLENDYSTYI